MLNVFLRESSKLQECLGKIDGIRWIMHPEDDDVAATTTRSTHSDGKKSGIDDPAVGENQTCIGMDALLIVLSRFRKHDPSSSEEMEAMENIFDCICCLLLQPENKHIFREMEGFELLLLLIRTRKKSRTSAVKMLDYALTQSPENCEYFVHTSGLKILFPVFMKMRLKKGDLDHEEHVLSSLFQLFENMDSEKLFYTRLMAKFEENEFEKANTLLDMWNVFRDRFSLWEHENQDRMMMLDEDEALMERISNGLLPLQMLAMMLIRLCYHSKNIREHVRTKFEYLNLSWKMLAAACEDYGKHFGEEGSKEREVVEANLIKMIAELYE
jgi:beta-catenin-like protein 1